MKKVFFKNRSSKLCGGEYSRLPCKYWSWIHNGRKWCSEKTHSESIDFEDLFFFCPTIFRPWTPHMKWPWWEPLSKNICNKVTWIQLLALCDADPSLYTLPLAEPFIATSVPVFWRAAANGFEKTFKRSNWCSNCRYTPNERVKKQEKNEVDLIYDTIKLLLCFFSPQMSHT